MTFLLGVLQTYLAVILAIGTIFIGEDISRRRRTIKLKRQQERDEKAWRDRGGSSTNTKKARN